jgi:hypothetical protein
VADGEGHGENGESEGEGYTNIADAEMDAGGEDGAAATSEDKPEGTEKLGYCTFGEMHRVTCSFCSLIVCMPKRAGAFGVAES